MATSNIAPWDFSGQQASVPWWQQQNPLAQPQNFAQTMSGYGQANPGQLGQTNLEAPAMSGFQKAGIGIQAGSALLNGFMGMKQYGLAKDSFNFQKEAFNKNYGNQVQTMNTNMEDRYRTAQASGDPTMTESLESYMQRNRVS